MSFVLEIAQDELWRHINACQEYYENPHSYRVADTHNFRFPEIDMTSILRSLPACFLEEHQWGGEAQFFYPTGQISDVIFKSYDCPIDVCFVSTLT